MPDPISPQNFSNVPQYQDNSQSSSGGTLGTVFRVGLGIAGAATNASPQGILGNVAGNLLGNGGSLGGFNGQLGQQQNQMMEMLELQNQMQLQNQQFTTLSNVSKTEHETRMAAVRNIRA